ncbi:MAG: 1-acyl-sn-glycerol-3-phosphate acyltransferase [Spirochaetia bacterium]|nr:1-acyl-sn-glycerol-3-phosphate acyltransferase [Spirochaetia bacterium]
MNDDFLSKVDKKKYQSEIKKIKRQKLYDHIIFYPLAHIVIFSLKFIFRYKIKNGKEIKEKYKKIVKENSPLLLCSNHLTLIDSLIIHMALGSVSWYLFNFKHFNWNVPAIENFTAGWFWRFMSYAGKCIHIDRYGTTEHHDMVIEKIRYLLKDGEICTIFPEGGRSRTSRVEIENTTYGIGKIIQGVEDCKVLCLYLRGESQNTYSDYPKWGEKFYLDLEVINPESKNKGMRQVRDYSMQVVTKLKEMEDKYFSLINDKK